MPPSPSHSLLSHQRAAFRWRGWSDATQLNSAGPRKQFRRSVHSPYIGGVARPVDVRGVGPLVKKKPSDVSCVSAVSAASVPGGAVGFTIAVNLWRWQSHWYCSGIIVARAAWGAACQQSRNGFLLPRNSVSRTSSYRDATQSPLPVWCCLYKLPCESDLRLHSFRSTER